MEEGKEAGFDAKSCDLEDFSPEAISQCKLAIFLMATYGEGEPTDNAAKFFKWIKSDDSDNSPAEGSLSSLSFTVFGLGNRQYEHYNRMGKLIDQLLEKFGGKRIFNYGEGDDDGTLEEDFDKWKSTLWSSLKEKLGAPATTGEENSEAAGRDSPTRRTRTDSFHHVHLDYTVKTLGKNGDLSNSTIEKLRKEHQTKRKIQNSTKHFFNPKFVPLSTKKELRNQDFFPPILTDGNDGVGSTLHLEFNLKGSGLTYHTADNLAILPENNSEMVNKLASILGYNLEEIIDFEPTEEGEENDWKLQYPTPCSVKELLTCYIDLSGKVNQSTLKHLVAYLQDSEQRKHIANLSKMENRPLFHLEIEEKHYNIVDLLTSSSLCSSLKLPLADFLHITSPIQARDYTISSSSLLFPSSVHITVSITEYHTNNENHAVGKQFIGKLLLTFCCFVLSFYFFVSLLSFVPFFSSFLLSSLS
jgi:NADPH-ferrihemoprotein reductase